MQKKRIVVIEDDPAICKLLHSRLTRSGYDVTIAEDGQLGLERVKEQRPDLVVLDLTLPGLPGEEIMRAIREDETATISKTPVIMLTAKSYDVDRIIGKVLGANCFMSKPFDAEALLNEVKRFINFD